MKGKEGSAPRTGEESATFEAMMARLHALVETLEHGNMSLEDSIRSFEEGVTLVKRCTEILDQAEQRIQKLTRGADGRPRTTPVEEDEEADEGRSGELPF